MKPEAATKYRALFFLLIVDPGVHVAASADNWQKTTATNTETEWWFVLTPMRRRLGSIF